MCITLSEEWQHRVQRRPQASHAVNSEAADLDDVSSGLWEAHFIMSLVGLQLNDACPLLVTSGSASIEQYLQ